jgi:hypothetical protein
MFVSVARSRAPERCFTCASSDPTCNRKTRPWRSCKYKTTLFPRLENDRKIIARGFVNPTLEPSCTSNIFRKKKHLNKQIEWRRWEREKCRKNGAPTFCQLDILSTWHFINCLLSHMIFSFFNDKRFLAPKYSGASSLEVLCPFIFLIRFSNRMLRPLIFLIRFSDQIILFFSVYKLLF